MEHYIKTYGYLGVLIWSSIGAEEGIIIAGVLAREGYMTLPGVILAAAIGGCIGDQVYFYMARFFGERLIKRSAKLADAYPKAQRLLEQYGGVVVLFSRFLLGLRMAVAIVCGTFKMHPVKYSILNFASGLMWATLFGSLAYYLGRLVWDRVRALPVGIVAGLGLLLAVALSFFIYLRRRRRPTPAPPAPDGDGHE